MRRTIKKLRPARTGPVPPRESVQHEDQTLDRAELSVRLMERVCNAIADSPDPKMRAVHIDVFSLFLDVLQEELQPFAGELAYAMYSRDKVASQRRRDWENGIVRVHGQT